MPTVSERLTHVTLKAKRAKEHIAELERAARRFLDTQPYTVSTKHDPQTRKLIYYVSSVKPTPACLPLIAGDVIQNLVSALDHLAYQIVCSDTGDNPPAPSRIYFPVADSAGEYEARKGRKIQGAGQETIDAIDAIKPYKGGNDSLWMLYRLNNIEKHRLLLTVGSHLAGVNLGQFLASHLPEFPPEARDMEKSMRAGLESMRLFFKSADTGFPLKPGFELLVGAVDAKPDPKQDFRFDIALSEPQIVESKSLLHTLHEFTTAVEGVIAALTPRLADTV